jgi:LPS export ABC transporter permease LptG
MRFWERLRPKIIDAYIIREILPPTLLGLLVFTFILLIDSIPRLLAILVSRGADFTTVVKVFLNLLPSILAVTIPIALRASGVSALRLLRPLLFLSFATTAITFYVNAVALPAANQAHRELIFSLVVSKARSAVRPRVFTDDLVPNMVVYVADIPADTGQWRNVLIQDGRTPGKPSVILSRTGQLVINKEKKAVWLALGEGVRHDINPVQPESYDQQKFAAMAVPLSFDEFFPKLPLSKGDREMTLPELQAAVQKARAEGKAPKDYARFEVEWHKKFAIPTACLVFGLLGLGLSLGAKKEARSAAFGLSIVVIFVYYVLIRMGEQAGDTGLMSPFLAMWGANIVLGSIGVLLLVLNQRAAAFDPLDPRQYLAWLPEIRRPRPVATQGAALSRPGGSPGPRTGARIVVRVPRFVLRLPSILDRYIARAYLGNIFLVLGAFCAIYTLAEFMDLIDDVEQNHVRGQVVVHYYAYHIFFIAHFMAPMAVLVGVLATFGILARRNEVTAMKAGGISLYRAAGPVLVVGILASLVLYGFQEFVLPTTNRIAGMDFNVIKGRPPQSSGRLDRRWVLGSDNRFYNYDYLTEKGRPVGVAEGRRGLDFSFFGLRVYDVDATSWEMRDVLYAREADWNGGGYNLQDGWRRTLKPRSAYRTFEAARTRDLEAPSYFRREERPSDTMSFPELQSHITSLAALGFDVLPLLVQLHRKLAFPLVALVMTLLGIPFAFVVARRGALYGIATSIVVAIVYWVFMETFSALGNNAILPPVLAAWAPNLIFGATGLYLMLTLDT